jgi:hypothetical protein
MQAKYFLIVIFLFITTLLQAQEKKASFEGSVQAGLLEGQQGSALHFGAAGGARIHTWSTTLGTGLDFYGVRSIPLYLTVQKNIFNRQQTPFVYAGGGYHFPWVPTNYKDSWGEYKTTGGLYYNAGIGYQLQALKKAALFFTAGFSFKQFSEETRATYMCLNGPCPEYYEKTEFGLKRLSVTTGLRF